MSFTDLARHEGYIWSILQVLQQQVAQSDCAIRDAWSPNKLCTMLETRLWIYQCTWHVLATCSKTMDLSISMLFVQSLTSPQVLSCCLMIVHWSLYQWWVPMGQKSFKLTLPLEYIPLWIWKQKWRLRHSSRYRRPNSLCISLMWLSRLAKSKSCMRCFVTIVTCLKFL